MEGSATECPVCHSDFTTPKLLPCTHSVCKECVISLLAVSMESACPLCDTQILPLSFPTAAQSDAASAAIDVTTYVRDLPTDLITIGRVECKAVLRGDHVCKICDDVTPAASFCLECRVKLCASCLKVHGKLPVTRYHMIEDLASLTLARLDETRVAPCTNHPERPWEKYCSKHQVLVCTECAKCNHPTCIPRTFVEDMASVRKMLTEKLEKMWDAKTLMTQQIDHMQATLEILPSQRESMRNVANTTFDHLQELLQDRRDTLLSDIDRQQYCEEWLLQLKPLVESHESKITRYDQFLSDVLDSKDDVMLGMLSAIKGPAIKGIDAEIKELDDLVNLHFNDNSSTELNTPLFQDGEIQRLESAITHAGTVTRLTSAKAAASPDPCITCGTIPNQKATIEELVQHITLKEGERVRPGKDFPKRDVEKQFVQIGTVIKTPSSSRGPGHVTVTWNTGQSFSHCMGADGRYELERA